MSNAPLRPDDLRKIAEAATARKPRIRTGWEGHSGGSQLGDFLSGNNLQYCLS
jgi:hypothetical protein